MKCLLSTQSELIQQYEDIRIPDTEQRAAVCATVTRMVEQRQLAVRAVDVKHSAIDRVLGAGVLVEAGDRVAFAHHVLFDHCAARFYLAWNDPEALRTQLSSNSSLGLLLGPALRFALEHMWQSDGKGRSVTWRFLVALAAGSDPDPVLNSIALRTVAERVDGPEDIGELIRLTTESPTADAVTRLLSQLARFVGMASDERGVLSMTAARSWASVARAAAASEDSKRIDASRVLLMTLGARADLSEEQVSASFGEAARELLRKGWSLRNGILATDGIRFVTKSYGSNPAASRALLDRILGERFAEHAWEEAPWLAEGVSSIISHDREFVSKIYETLFARDVTDESKTALGGGLKQDPPAHLDATARL